MSAGRKDSVILGEVATGEKLWAKTGLLFWVLGLKVVDSIFEELVNIEDRSEGFEYSGIGLGFLVRGILIIFESLEVLSKVLSVWDEVAEVAERVIPDLKVC